MACPLLLLAGGACLALAAAAAADAPAEEHWWPHARGRVGQYGHTDLPGPKDLKAQLAWEWQHPEMAIVTGALLDKEKNIYISSMDGIRKLTPEGSQLWQYRMPPISPVVMQAVPVLVGDMIFASTMAGNMIGINATTGMVVWDVRHHAQDSEMDTPYVEVEDGVVMQAFMRLPDVPMPLISGNRRIVAANATNGALLWDYMSDTILWNFQPAFIEDGTFLVMDIHGGLRRFRTRTGEQVNYVQPPEPWQNFVTFTDGGVILGPGGKIAYTCSNLGGGSTDTPGVLRAYRVGTSDLELLWVRNLPQPCVSWPASDGRTVVVPVGALPVPTPPYANELWLPVIGKLFMHWISLALGDYHNLLFGFFPAKRMAVLAFDAETGSPQWVYDRIKPWPRLHSRGDEELVFERFARFPWRPVCGPASWSAPTISGDGTVYAAGMNGILYAIRDANSDGIIADDEVSTLDVGAASLHQGSSFAPGMMTFATCAGVYVFKT